MTTAPMVAPAALAAGEIDLTHHAFAKQRGSIGLHHLGYEFVARRAAKAIVAALQFEIGIADATGHSQFEERGRPGSSWGTGISCNVTAPP